MLISCRDFLSKIEQKYIEQFFKALEVFLYCGSVKSQIRVYCKMFLWARAGVSGPLAYWLKLGLKQILRNVEEYFSP